MKSIPAGGGKKVLYVHHDMGNSGASRSLSFLLGKLDGKGFNARVHCIFGGPVVDLFKKTGTEILPGRGIFPFHGSTVTGMSLKMFLTNFIRLPQSFFAAYNMIRKNRPDIVHLNSSCLFITAMAAKLVDRTIRVVCHVREPLLKFSLSAAIMRYMNYFFVDHFIAIDRFTGGSMRSRNNMSVVYNAVNFEEYNPDVRSDIIRHELGLQQSDVIFLYLARISKSNGALELIDAARKLSGSFPSFHFVFAGCRDRPGDSYSGKVAAAAAACRNVHLMTFRNDVPALIAGADIMVVPFTKPHFARSVVESSAMGKPAIGANTGGVNELIVNNETGFLYNNGRELCDCCIRLGSDPLLREKMGRSALQFARLYFDNNTSSGKVFEIYNRLLTH